MNKNRWDTVIRILHYLMAIGVFFQLILSFFMQPPQAGTSETLFQLTTYSFHRWIGIFVFFIVLLHLFWVIRSRDYRSHLFPYSRQGFYKIKEDIKTLLHLQLPETGPRQGIGGLFHGLGFLAVLGMGLTGTFIFFFVKNFYSFFPSLHSFISYFVWVYFIGHTLMACFHRFMKKSW